MYRQQAFDEPVATAAQQLRFRKNRMDHEPALFFFKQLYIAPVQCATKQIT
jgi:hypothetical protein